MENIILGYHLHNYIDESQQLQEQGGVLLKPIMKKITNSKIILAGDFFYSKA